MLLELKNLKQSVGDETPLSALAAKKLRLGEKDICSTRIIKRSVDARDKNDILFVHTVLVEVKEKAFTGKLHDNHDIQVYNDSTYEFGRQPRVEYGSRGVVNRPLIIGTGPAGLFAGLILAENGYKPLLLERGGDVDSRTACVETFFRDGSFDETSNIQFGEGGAGTFSDGKLTTRIKDLRCDAVLKSFVQAGAPQEIEYINKPHVGTDILKIVVKNIRKRIEELGGEVRFFARVTDIIIKDGAARAVEINGSEHIDSNVIIAALGHSARDTYSMLHSRGVKLVPKPFSIGVRIEHLQDMVNEAQYGRFAGHPRLGAADYTLTFRSNTTGRSAYSFCMCPGGMVVAAASENGMLVTNGMSEYKRDRENANSALVVSVAPEDFGSSHPLSGIEFQRHWESRAYALGGGNFHAPVQLAGDFLKGINSSAIGGVKPSYRPGTVLRNMNDCLPDYVTVTMREAIADFDRKLKGFASRDAVLTGVETRTSAPLRIVRKEDMESENTTNLYPAGEGAGYAGGIISAAVDGIKVAERIMQKFKPL